MGQMLSDLNNNEINKDFVEKQEERQSVIAILHWKQPNLF